MRIVALYLMHYVVLSSIIWAPMWLVTGSFWSAQVIAFFVLWCVSYLMSGGH